MQCSRPEHYLGDSKGQNRKWTGRSYPPGLSTVSGRVWRAIGNFNLASRPSD